MKRMTLAQAELLSDYYGYSIEIDGDSGFGRVYNENEVYLYDVRLI
jgi:hypothetical protein